METVPQASTRPPAGTWARLADQVSHIGRGVAFAALVWLLVAFCLAPFVWLIMTSLKTPDDLYRIPPRLVPVPLDHRNYVTIWQGRPFLQNIINSIVVASAATSISVVVASLSSYALARLQFPGKSVILALTLAVAMFPGIAIVSPLYLFFAQLGLINNKLSLILPYVTFTLPLCVWLLTAYFRDLPIELEEAATVDGATRLQTLWRVTAPLAAPGIVTVALLSFIFACNEFLFARTFMTRTSAYTVPPALALFEGTGTFVIPWGQITAASVVVTLPLIALVLLFQRRIVAGLTAGAIRG